MDKNTETELARYKIAYDVTFSVYSISRDDIFKFF